MTFSPRFHFDDGNGRAGRILATAELWRSGYRMRGFLSFEEHFDAERARYYHSLQMDLPVSFYDGRNDPDHTPWLEHFTGTVARAARDLQAKAAALHVSSGVRQRPWESLSRRHQQVLSRLFARAAGSPSQVPDLHPGDLVEWFGISSNTARECLRDWCAQEFLATVPSGRGVRVRRYQLADGWQQLLNKAVAAGEITQVRERSPRRGR